MGTPFVFDGAKIEKKVLSDKNKMQLFFSQYCFSDEPKVGELSCHIVLSIGYQNDIPCIICSQPANYIIEDLVLWDRKTVVGIRHLFSLCHLTFQNLL